MKTALLIGLMFVLVGCDKAIHSETPVVQNEYLNAIVNEFENALKSDVVRDGKGSISAAIVNGDKVIWSKAFGYADADNKIPADSTTIYRAGSISKSFTAFLMMKLVDEGIIKLNDPVDLYLPEVKNLLGYSDTTRFTFLQLASHTAGLSREPQLKDAASGPIDDWEGKLLASIPTTYFIGKPGATFSYSNIGFGILGLALSRAAGEPFMKLMQERVFAPLEMSRSFYVVPANLEDKLAAGVDGDSSNLVDRELPRIEHSGRGYKVPNGGIYSTPSDLAKFMICNLGYNSILKNESLEMMQVKQGLKPNDYGIGFMVFENDEVSIAGHNGRVAGYTAQLAFEKESKFGVIIMRNYTEGATDLDKAAFILLSKLKQEKNKEEQL